MNTEQPRNPLHGVTLEQIITDLVDTFGWEVLAQQVHVNCFRDNPSVKSSLKFLRKTQWARDKVESLYVYAIVRGKPPNPKPNIKLKHGQQQNPNLPPPIAIFGKPLAKLPDSAFGQFVCSG